MKLIINNRDRLHSLQEMVAWGLAAGHEVVIVDQASTYPPLLELYTKQFPSSEFRVIHRANVGPWPDIRSGMAEFGKPGEFVAYSDSDVDLAGCPRDMLEQFAELLIDNRHYRKVGCALRIDDLPETSVATHARKREAEFWTKPSSASQLEAFVGKIASTLAVYRVGESGRTTAGLYGPALRVAGVYTARHRPWYYTAENMPDDERYYLEHLGRSGPVFSRILRKELSRRALAPVSSFEIE